MVISAPPAPMSREPIYSFTKMNEQEFNRIYQKALRDIVAEGLFDRIKGVMQSNRTKLIQMLEKEGFSEDYHDEGRYDMGMELDADGTEGRVRISIPKNDLIWQVEEEGYYNDDNWGEIKDISKKTDAELQKIVQFIMAKVTRIDTPSPNSVDYKKYQANRATKKYDTRKKHADGEEWKNLQEKNSTMVPLANTLHNHAKAATRVALKFQGTKRQQLEQWRKAFKAYQKVQHVYWKQGIAGMKKAGKGLGERPIEEWLAEFDKESAEGYRKHSEELDKVSKIAVIISKKLGINEFGWPAGPDSSTVITVWEVYERDGTGCLIYLREEDARASDIFENGHDKISKANLRLSADEIKTLQARKPIYLS